MRPLVIAAPASGSGKTSVTLGLLAAFSRQGVPLAPFKVGPDYLDPGHHAAACGRTSRNLDGWMCGRPGVEEVFRKGCEGADLALIEGVMGLFDGACGETDLGSSAEVCRWLDGRIVLVVDARAQARSAAALVQGFCRFDPRLEFAGVIFNRVGSARHAQLLRAAMASVPGLPPLLGCLPRQEDLALPERHLGLVGAEEADAAGIYRRLADWVSEHLDLEPLLAERAPQPVASPAAAKPVAARVRIGVARDEAFCFYYPDNLERLAAAGAELAFFSPLRDARLPEGLAGLYLGGGYPELHAEGLAANRSLLAELRRAALGGMPVYAECGGMMLLAESIDGRSMAGIFPGEVHMLQRRRALGYREVTLLADGPLGPAGRVLRGHEFHYSEFSPGSGLTRQYRLSRADGEDLGPEGYRRGNVLGSYVHLHFAGNPEVAEDFVRFCERQARSR